MTLVIGAAGAASCGQDGPGSPPAHRQSKAGAPESEPSKKWTAPRAAELPKHAVAGDERPSLGEAGTMAAGYTGKDFLARLAKDWKLKLDKPVDQEMPDGKKRTYVHGRGGSGISVSAGYADHVNMSSLVCRSGAKQSDGLGFLAACAGLDVAGIDHGKASAWLEQAKKETDSLYSKRVAETGMKEEYVVSGAFTAGRVVMVLHRGDDNYSLRVLGGAVA
ncbi:hypothetical protein ACFWMT_03995 [Streptomyces sp. NPDC058368]|uniref:hypothetical protein n=1 Tax=Streptomyces sp. NPDC058368 TaxID=3346461 RepID=UPI00365E50C6